MSIPRDIGEVHNKIMNVIPDENIDFKSELQEYMVSISFRAPEIRRSSITFTPYAVILYKYIPNPELLNENDPIWKFQVRDIFNGV